MTKNEKIVLRNDALNYLRGVIKAGDTVYTSLSHVSRSGMLRHIGVYIPYVDDSGKQSIRRISWEVANILDYKTVPHGTDLKVGGCGMDMGYHVVYSLSRALFADGFPFLCIGDNCPSNDHVNGTTITKGGQHSDGGYALNHQWL